MMPLSLFFLNWTFRMASKQLFCATQVVCECVFIKVIFGLELMAWLINNQNLVSTCKYYIFLKKKKCNIAKVSIGFIYFIYLPFFPILQKCNGSLFQMSTESRITRKKNVFCVRLRDERSFISIKDIE